MKKRRAPRWPAAAAVGGAVAIALLAMVAIPVSRPMPDFSRLTAHASNAASGATAPAGPSPTAVAEAGSGPSPRPRNVSWAELMPRDWDPAAQVQRLWRDLDAVGDATPQAAAIHAAMQSMWDHAPTEPAMDGQTVRIPGYVVPIDEARSGTTEFLLVPYFGACIHAPPPPSNQIIRVLATPAGRHWHSMDEVWVSGRLTMARTESVMGNSGWQLQALRVEPYAEPAQ